MRLRPFIPKKWHFNYFWTLPSLNHRNLSPSVYLILHYLHFCSAIIKNETQIITILYLPIRDFTKREENSRKNWYHKYTKMQKNPNYKCAIQLVVGIQLFIQKERQLISLRFGLTKINSNMFFRDHESSPHLNLSSC